MSRTGHLRAAGLVVLCLLLAQTVSAQITTATVTGGTIAGVVRDGVAVFKGIPFAAPPVGALRWKPPAPVVPWSGVKQTVEYGPVPIQDGSMIGRGAIRTSEDCLTLNVWTGATSRDERRPVMVWIYGGGFSGGMAGFPVNDGTRFAQRGVVLVSLAYRVGVFGFLAHPELSRETGKGSGAVGLQDQIAALRWVRENIAQFGGDRDRVTIFGESAGAISVSMLAASPAARGLFHRAISQSGGSFAPIRRTTEAGQNVPSLAKAEAAGMALFETLGVKTLAEARALPADTILKAGPGMGTFWPAADGHTITGDQYERYLAGQFNDTPILVGTNSDEGAMFVRSGVTPERFTEQIRAGYGPAADAILAAYPHATADEALQAMKNIFRDSGFAWHTWAWASLQAAHGKGRAFVYYFDHRTPASPGGASHASEIPFVFGNLGGGGVPPSAEAQRLSDHMLAYWVNFAATGDPNGPGLPTWPVYAETTRQVMSFDGVIEARPLPNVPQLLALDRYYAWRRAEYRKNETVR